MSERAKSFIAVYLAFLASALAIAAMTEDNYRSRAARLDLKVLTLELKGSAAIIDGMNDWRNETRARAEQMEASVVLLAIAFAVASPALIASAAGGWFLILVSWVASGSAAYFVWLAVGRDLLSQF